jgi:hypothetical protein
MQPSTDILAFADPMEWESWLCLHHAASTGAWLKIGKKNAKRTLITIDEALDVALCYGWIDSQRKGFDASSYLQRYSARRTKSPANMQSSFRSSRQRPRKSGSPASARRSPGWHRPNRRYFQLCQKSCRRFSALRGRERRARGAWNVTDFPCCGLVTDTISDYMFAHRSC